MSISHNQRDHVQELLERYYQVDSGELHFSGLPVSEIVERHGSPLFIYDRNALDQKWSALRNSLPNEVDIYYSIKANPNQTILAYFLSRGCGLEVASGGELFQALEAGCPPENIVFAGPGKTERELADAVASGVGEIHIESLREAEHLSVIAAQASRNVKVAVRINPAHSVQGGAMRMGGKPAPFGIDEEQLDATIQRLKAMESLDVVGVHLFTGTQILDHVVFQVQFEKAVQIAERVAVQLDRPLETIDFGGGLGIPYFPHETALDIRALGEVLATIVRQVKQRPLLADARLILEPGRFLVGEAGLYVTRVIDVKESRGNTFVVTDGGMHHHLAASGNLGQTIKRNYPVALVNRLDETTGATVDVVGPLCTPLDVLARNVALPRPRIGDLFGVFQSGAYARSASPLGFLSHPTPPEVWVDGGIDSIIRRRGTYADAIDDQCPVPFRVAADSPVC
jgi:diaminopimelate decarboxylase